MGYQMVQVVSINLRDLKELTRSLPRQWKVDIEMGLEGLLKVTDTDTPMVVGSISVVIGVMTKRKKTKRETSSFLPERFQVRYLCCLIFCTYVRPPPRIAHILVPTSFGPRPFPSVRDL